MYLDHPAPIDIALKYLISYSYESRNHSQEANYILGLMEKELKNLEQRTIVDNRRTKLITVYIGGLITALDCDDRKYKYHIGNGGVKLYPGTAVQEAEKAMNKPVAGNSYTLDLLYQVGQHAIATLSPDFSTVLKRQLVLIGTKKPTPFFPILVEELADKIDKLLAWVNAHRDNLEFTEAEPQIPPEAVPANIAAEAALIAAANLPANIAAKATVDAATNRPANVAPEAAVNATANNAPKALTPKITEHKGKKLIHFNKEESVLRIKMAVEKYLDWMNEHAKGHRFITRFSHFYHGTSGRKRAEKLLELINKKAQAHDVINATIEASKDSGLNIHSLNRFLCQEFLAQDVFGQSKDVFANTHAFMQGHLASFVTGTAPAAGNR